METQQSSHEELGLFDTEMSSVEVVTGPETRSSFTAEVAAAIPESIAREEELERRRAVLRQHTTIFSGRGGPKSRESSESSAKARVGYGFGGKGMQGVISAGLQSVSATKNSMSAAVSWLGDVGSKLVTARGNGGKLKGSDNLDSVADAFDACTSLRRALDAKHESQVVSAMDVMSALAQRCGPVMVRELDSGGACACTDQVLSWRGASQAVAESALRVFCALAIDKGVRNKIISGGACYRIIKVLNAHINDEIILEWGMRVVRYLALEDFSMPKLFASGVCELVATAFNTHINNDSIIEWACRIVYALAQDELIQDKLAAADVCEAIVVGVLQERAGSKFSIDIAIWCQRAIGVVARKNTKNMERLANLGACELIMKLFEQFGLDDIDFAESHCWAVGNMAFPDETAQLRLALAGACSSVVRALELHLSNSEMAQEGLRAIRNLGHLNAHNLILLSEATAPEVVVQTIKFHSLSEEGVDMLQWGWFAVASLCDRRENLRIFGSCGACQELVRTIKCLNSSPGTMQWACLAVSKLAQDPDISKFIGHEGACIGLTGILNMHINTSEVIEECFNAIGSLCFHQDHSNRDVFSSFSFADCFVKALIKHERQEFVVEQACWALSSLFIFETTTNSDVTMSNFISAGVCKVLPRVVSKFSDNEKVCEYGSQVLATLGNLKCQAKLGAAGAAHALVSTLEKHTMNQLCCRWSLQAIRFLCIHEESLLKLRVANVHVTISRVLQLYQNSSEELSRLSLDALAELSNDEICKIKLGRFEGCAEAIVATISAHVGSDILILSACSLIIKLCSSTAQTSLLDAFVQSTNGGANLSDDALTTSVSYRLGCFGVADIFTAVLIKHIEKCDIVAAVCKAIESACSGDNDISNRGKFGRCGVPSLLVQVFRTSLGIGRNVENSNFLSFICRAIASLLLDGSFQTENQHLFSTLELPALLKQSFESYFDSAIVVESTCLVVSLLVSSNSSSQINILEQGVLELLPSIFNRFPDNERVVLQACFAVAELSLNNHPNSIVLGRLGICKDIISTLVLHKNNEKICGVCCRAIFSMKDLNVQLGADGACEAVLSILALHPGSENVAQWVCRAIGSLAENLNNKKILGASCACEVVTAALQRHVANETLISVVFMRNTSSAGVAQWGCAAMYFLARGHGKLEEEYRRKLVAAGACEAVAKALVKYSEVESVAQACCRAAVVLIDGKDREDYAARLGSLGVCSTVVDALHLFPSSIPVAKWGCRAVAVLAENCEANVVRLVAAGCCEVVPIAMQAHQTSEAVAGAGCDAITSLAASVKSGYAARLGHTGACESVVSVLRRHFTHADVIERGCRAMANLALVKGNSSWFGPAGACDALLKVQRHHPNNESLAAAAWLAAGSLCVDNNNRHRLGQVGACEQVVESMCQLYIFPSVARAAGSAIGKVILCETSFSPLLTSNQPPLTNPPLPFAQIQFCEVGTQSVRSTPDLSEMTISNSTAIQVDSFGNEPSIKEGSRENRERLFKSGCCDIIVQALIYHSGDMSVALSLCRSIGIVAHGDQSTQERDQFGVVGACAAVVRAMQQFQSSDGVARCGCLAIRALAFEHTNNKKSIRHAGGCQVVVDALRNHSLTPTGPLVHEAAAWAVSNLAQECPENKELLGSIGAVEAVLDAFEQHGRYLEVSRWCCAALRHLSDGNENNRSKISFSSAAELLSSAMQKYSAEEELVECALLTMIVVCADRVGQHRLGLVGVCKVVVSALQRSDVITSLACELIAALSFKSPDNQTKLGQAGACKVILTTLEWLMLRTGCASGLAQRKNTSLSVIETMKDMLGSSSTLPETQDRNVAFTATLGSLGDTQRQIGSIDVLLCDCLMALLGLVNDHEANRSKLFSLGALELLSTILNSKSLGEKPKEKARECMEVLVA